MPLDDISTPRSEQEAGLTAEAFLARPAPKPRPAWLSGLIFAAVFVVLQALYGLAADTVVERWIVEKATVLPTVAVLQETHPEWQVRADGPRVVAAGKRINVRYGCEGTEVVFLLIAALLAVSAPWRWRLLGMASGVVVVWSLNQGRLLALVQVLVERREWFSSVHGAIAPLLVITFTALFFLAWLRFLPTDAAR